MAPSQADIATPAAGGRSRALLIRVVSGLVLGGLALGVYFLGRPVFPIFVCVFAVLLAWEWGRLCSGRSLDVAPVLLPLAMIGVAIAAFLRYFDLAIAIALIAAPTVHLLVLAVRARGPAWSAVGAGYIALALVAYLWIYDLPDGGLIVLWLVFVVVATDTGAFFVGRHFGGAKLAPRISPSKTWSGLAGGMLAAAAMGVICTYVLTGGLVWSHAPIGALAAVVAQAGDLFESIVKRHFGVKDSSGILPGHGGLLDRFDGLIAAFAAAAVAIWASGATTDV